MQAMVYTQYGSPAVLHLQEVAQPAPRDGEVLVKIQAASLNAADWHLLRADPFLVRLMAGGLLKPKHSILGADIAGTVAAVGPGVRQFQPGDAVFGALSVSHCGGFAEYVAAPESELALKPARLSFEQAAAVPLAALTALQGLRDAGQLQPGQTVLINGASGGVGTFAVQIAKALGAHVTAVVSPRNVALARSLGADTVIDYTQTDFTRAGQQYDLILAANGYHSLADYRRALKPGGRYVMAGGAPAQMYQALLVGRWAFRGGSQQARVLSARPKPADLAFIKALLEAGQINPVIDRCYPLAQLPDAFRYLEDVHAQGKVVITIGR